MSNKKSIEILEKMKQVAQVRTDSDLSEALGVSPQTLSSWKGRDSIPYAICIDFAQARGVSLDWLFGSQSDTLLSLNSCSAGLSGLTEQKMLQMFRVLNESDRSVIYNLAEEKQQLQALLWRVEELSVRLESVIKRR
ncbi:MAG: helix-turn-helix domain-containing protein [Pseudomonadota bacterium]